MSRVDIVTVSDGEANTITNLNTMFNASANSWDTATASVNEENVRREGIDRGNINFSSDQWVKFTQGEWTTAYALTTAFLGQPIPMGTVVQVTAAHGGYLTNQRVVRASMEVVGTGVPGGGQTLEVQAKLIVSTNGGASWSDLHTSPAGIRTVRNSLGAHHTNGIICLHGLVSVDSCIVGIDARMVRSGGAGTANLDNVVMTMEALGG